VVHCDHASILHVYGDVEFQRFWSPSVTTLTVWDDVTSSGTWPFDSPCEFLYSDHALSCTVMEIWRFEVLGYDPDSLGVTWRQRSYNHRIRRPRIPYPRQGRSQEFDLGGCKC